MICIAAFIILCIIGIFVFFLSFWKPEIGKKYLKLFKKAWGCVGKRITLQKCESNFKDDIKNSILKKFIIKKPKLVKPISIAIEILAVIIVFITVFSLVEATKAGLALYSLGSCNVSNPDSCILGNFDSCPTNEEKLNWFQEWRVIFNNIPDRIKKWEANDFLNEDSIYYKKYDKNKETALDIFDPLCSKCMISFKNQLSSGFFNKYNVGLIPYSIKGDSKEYRFNNSYLIALYILAINQIPLDDEVATSWQLIIKLANEEYAEDILWQYAFTTDEITETDVHEIMFKWLKEIGYNDDEVQTIKELTVSQELKDKMKENEKMVDNVIGIRGVPTTIYNGKKHTGVFNK